MLRTSLTDPIRIDEVRSARVAGVIGISFCPGKKDGAKWDRDLKLDLDAIAAWGAIAVVTLIEEHEFSLLHVERLGAEVQERGMRWFHLPIRDVSIPDGLFEDRWRTEGAALGALLADGARIVVHCRGGLGRAGMISARLLIEAGDTPDDALAAVRRARPDTVETEEQERYVRRLGKA